MNVDFDDELEKCEVPDENWSLQKLARLIEEEQDAFRHFGRKTAIHTWRLGRILSIAKGKSKSGQWSVYLKNVGVSIASDHRARRLFDHFEFEEELNGLTITEAYREAGIGKLTDPEAVEIEDDGTDESPTLQITDTDSEEEEEEEEEESKTALSTLRAQRKIKPHSAPQPETPAKENPADYGRRLAQLEAAAASLVANITPASSAEEHDSWKSLITGIRAHLDCIEEGISHE